MPLPSSASGADASRHSGAVRAAFDAARAELRADVGRGAGGRGALERYADRVDAMLRQLYPDAQPPPAPVAILALGGYGRRHLCLHSDIDLLILFGGAIGRPTRSGSFAASCTRCGISAWSSAIRCASSTSSPSSRPTTPSSCWRCSTRGRSPGSRDCSIASAPRSTPRRTHAFILDSLLQLIDERHAQFNDTLYQLEPDVKEAPGALRDLTATRHDRDADRSAAAAARPGRPGARSTTAEDFLLRVRSTLHLESGRNQNVLEPRAAGARGGACSDTPAPSRGSASSG